MSEAKYLTVDNLKVKIEDERNILEIVRKANIELPTFCYHSELSVYGACRLCIVDVQGRGILSACSTAPEEGMVVKTQTAEIQNIRKITIELLLASGEHDCSTCSKTDNCKLREISSRLGVREIRFKAPKKPGVIDTSSPGVYRDQSKCILCGDCVRACDEIQGIGAIDFAGRGPTTVVTPAYNLGMGDVDCVHCGQCARVCPVGALVVNPQTDAVWRDLNDPNKQVVVQIAPAVRIAISEEFGMQSGIDMTGQMVTALRMMGFNKVYDTGFTADLTIIEEAAEFMGRKTKGENLPLFTSCCPAWVKYAEQYFPSLLKHVSSCRSPQQMFGSLAKAELPKQLGVDLKDLVVVSIMPCTAKKFEGERPEFSKDGHKDIDHVITTQELASMIRKCGILFDKLPSQAFDLPFGMKSGAGLIFGNSGGVTEAVARYVTNEMKTPGTSYDVETLRATKSRKELQMVAGDIKVKICVVSSLKEAAKIGQEVLEGKVDFDLIEVMACPGGCIGGAGQPVTFSDQTRAVRKKALYELDGKAELRHAGQNVYIEQMKKGDYSSHSKCHDLLHTHYHSRKRIGNQELEVHTGADAEKIKVKVCVGTSCFLRGSTDLLQKLIHRVNTSDMKDKVEIAANFCTEKCSHGPTVWINDQHLSHAKLDQVLGELAKAKVGVK